MNNDEEVYESLIRTDDSMNNDEVVSESDVK